MKNLLLLIATIIFCSCGSSKKLEETMNSWMGNSKGNLIMSWGPPTQTTSDGKDGEVLIYAQRVYYQLTTGPVDYWDYKMMYANGLGTLYHWIARRSPNPPERVDVRVLSR